jgi:nitrite reductase/ring-hydroxylating ferredoxin subunit
MNPQRKVNSMNGSVQNYEFAIKLSELRARGGVTVRLNNQTIALFLYGERVFAVDNRCPHMGFPLHRGTIKDGILTCHWHHARFDLASGGTFDPWADDVASFPVALHDDEVWVDPTPQNHRVDHQQARLREGMQRNLPLVIGKAVINLVDSGDVLGPFKTGLDFGVHYRQSGWGQGLTILTCMYNIIPYLYSEDRPRALYHGLSAVASNTSGSPPRFPIQPLPETSVDRITLKRWFRRFIEVRDAEGAERCLISALSAGFDHHLIADMLFSAVTDHRYINIGHPLDFTNKALEALDAVGWQSAGSVLTSLVSGYASANRMEESNAWRNPIDLIAILEEAFDKAPGIVEKVTRSSATWGGGTDLVSLLLDGNPQSIVTGMLTALREGCSPEDLAGLVVYTAALRIARFHTSNELGDWDTALHTFTFANAVHQGMRRAVSIELLRGVFDAAMSIYLDRFLNVPPVHLPEPDEVRLSNPEGFLKELPYLLNQQQQVNEAGNRVAGYLFGGGSADRLMAVIGHMLLREDRDFHTIQTVEAAFRQYSLLVGSKKAIYVLVAAARYLAAHSPTLRAQGQTYQIASRLYRGEKLYEGEDEDSP